MYKGVLLVPKEATIIGLEGNLAVVVVAKQPAAPEKEAALFINHRKRDKISVHVGGHIITSKPVIIYLKVMINVKINFKEQLKYTCEKATNVPLTRMMSNISDPIYSRRLLVIHATQLYAAPVWKEALACQSNWRRINMTYRLVVLVIAPSETSLARQPVLLPE